MTGKGKRGVERVKGRMEWQLGAGTGQAGEKGSSGRAGRGVRVGRVRCCRLQAPVPPAGDREEVARREFAWGFAGQGLMWAGDR